MSNKKTDKGKFYHKLHGLQKIMTRLLKMGKIEETKIVEVKEKHLLEKIKGKNKK